MTDPFELFKRDPKVDARILGSIQESDFFPTRGQYFRVRTATVADRSYMGDIWLCIESQQHCAVGKKVLDTYSGTDPKQLGRIHSFIAGDVIFYDCTQIWDAVLRDAEEAAAKAAQQTEGKAA